MCEGRRRVKPQCVLNKSVCTYLWCEKRKRERTRNVTAHSVGLPPVQLSTIGVTHRMMGLRQSLRDSQSLMRGGKPWSNITGSDCGRVCRGGVEVSSTRRRSPWVNMRRSLRVGAWNVLSLREDDHLSSSEVKRLDIGIAALSVVRRPDCGDIMVGGCAYY